MKRILLATAAVLVAALTPPALAEKADRDQPVNIEADRLTVDDRNKVHIFEGGVILTQGTLVIRGDKLVVTQDAAGFQNGVATAAGMLLAWGLLSLPLDPWRIALLVILLAFTIETLVVRHYGLAVIFITPLTLLLAEAATLGHAPLAELIESRFTDTLLGCVVGLVGGVCLHSARFRELVGGPLRRLMPHRPQS